MASYKSGRMSEDIRRIISAKMRELKDPRIGGGEMLTVVRCEVASDGSFCKVYISSLEGFDKAKQAVKGFESASGYLKREISNVLGLRKAPDLKFVADDSAEYSARIFAKLKKIVPADAEEVSGEPEDPAGDEEEPDNED
ncbi:MAG: 30S ribosome-binding factor RbfA [Ruminococcus sp.]|nr:30S ribosome-binding factor RbfA [Ruminococcus sp.]